MESIAACNWPVNRSSVDPLGGGDDAHIDQMAAGRQWLAAIPQPAAILSLRDEDDIFVLEANAAFTDSFRSRRISQIMEQVAAEWRDRVNSFIQSDRVCDSFELRRDGPLGPEYFMCTIGRLPVDGPAQFLFTAIDRTSDRTIEKNLRRELLSDGLTALPNRTGFGEEIDDRLSNTVWPDNAQFGIIAIDLSRFSRVNESLGPMAGDELLITVAKRLKSSLRQGDVLARIGGNDFAIFARLNNGLSDALHIVQRIREALSSPIRLSDLQIRVDCAIGCALSIDLQDDPDDVVRKAQAAVKIAKRSGKVEIYRNGVLKEAQRRFSIESRLREALAHGGLTLAYQPLIHLQTGEITGFEALARWNDPELGHVPPVEFIAVAEESGLITSLGRWAAYEAAQALSRWDVRFGQPLPVGVNVNLSPIQMARDDVASMFEEALRYSGIAGSRLTAELTESAIIADPDKARKLLFALKDLQMPIAMDDFGTGFSNLASLHSLPIDILKIDRSFVSSMAEDRDKAVIVRTILSLAESLNLKVTAEGIETQELALALQQMGCWQGQGYYFAKPMTEADAFDYWRARWNFETI
ncbi:putative bifunctional diguanylate cyclase/phosphodiesterase [Sphingobium sp. Ant17]|uniref:putative bifunctional diguanylate cyclase/phosphodiesterase n=1 Tax=Sphingobium sp. Ant17 TaxID=1461752 RepID=UPI00044920DE|nr:EAL domain-containing protein [Sphingobium sp. Ant17]EXS70170.1 diguanylate cyclase [Sphingobium sp. Ant17]OHC98187.1 MAG: diguanylate cyclase [Sphingomonadales bacterium GWF1_63_6]